MQSVPFKGLVLIRDSANEVSGLPLWSFFVRKTLDTNFSVTIGLLVHLKRDLPEELAKDQRLKVIECLDSNSQLNQLKRDLLDEEGEVQEEKPVLFLDSIDILLQRFGLPQTAQFLFSLAEAKGAIFSVTTQDRFDTDSFEEQDLSWKQLCSVASSSMELSLSRGGELVCWTKTKKKKDGLVSEKVEKYSVSPKDFSVSSSSFANEIEEDEHGEYNASEQKKKKPEERLLQSLPFDIGLNLREREREAKASVQLPYVKAQEERGLVGLNISSGKRIRAGGQILYTPDKDDDLDDSDPDDDLMI